MKVFSRSETGTYQFPYSWYSKPKKLSGLILRIRMWLPKTVRIPVLTFLGVKRMTLVSCSQRWWMLSASCRPR